ncbi:S8 family peptidase [Catelliglobosispora koreensis]|uniref:S8 family peptidase n=1 Tax=Catelliglobosispora koreensis TaxID=129052 RepID=UPI0003777C16|nr:S8 family peptidase [Catelliglobosispora koreensis]
MRHKLAAATLIAAALSVSSGTAATAVPAEDGYIVNAASPHAVDGRYIVVLKDQSGAGVQSAGAKAAELTQAHGGSIRHSYAGLFNGFAAQMTAGQAKAMARNSKVSYVEQVLRMSVQDTQNNPPNWGDDRVDQRDLPLNQTFTYPSNPGQGVTVYVLDTGINVSHQDFTGRVGSGYDFVDNDSNPADCHGHGTHVAGTAAGTTYGIAKKATVVALRVLNCQGSGYDDDFIAAINWIRNNGTKPAVANYSIGCGSPCSSQALDSAVQGLVDWGVQFVMAAGNSNQDACGFSPQKVSAGITVGNTTSSDAKNSGSSWGSCLDLFAPGTSIVSASHSSNNGSATMTGTSMASPHVAGAAAVYLGQNSGATSAQVRNALVNNGTTGKVTNPGSGSPNVLLYTGFMNGTPTGPAVTNPGNQSTVINTAASLQMQASGGTTPYSWSATGLPAGLSISSSSGLISGTPTAAGTSNVTVTVTDASNQSGSTSFTWAVTSSGGTCSGHEFTTTGSLSAGAAQIRPSSGSYYSSVSGAHKANLCGPSGADFDLYLQRWNGFSWVNVAVSDSPSNHEAINYSGIAGYYRYRVYAYGGSGAYTLGYTNP